ncbi:MAG: 4-hydroxy-tetrahydrodipicolinate reductase [Armatimonadetes bacterium]|nr:4-hydroxy-tetrahydrodipicolinate reductase [Armatimonadota bacterium]MDE2207061.1 4-hydroxy-tetrahydrodipicolinate reductase [Armatimonadota bacterium]
MSVAELRVIVSGALGRMGMEVGRAVAGATDLQIAAGYDPDREAAKAALWRDATGGALLVGELSEALAVGGDVLVDFTHADAARLNIRDAVAAGLHVVLGTTGIAPSDLEAVGAEAAAHGTAILFAPNFAIGAVLMMQFAERAAAYLPDAEIVEMHHSGKRDAPSGTAKLTAQRIVATRSAAGAVRTPGPAGPALPSRGLNVPDENGVPVHSIRLPGLVAHQEITFGGAGETLTIRHDSMSRSSFMPGILLAIRRVHQFQGLVTGLEHLL